MCTLDVVRFILNNHPNCNKSLYNFLKFMEHKTVAILNEQTFYYLCDMEEFLNKEILPL